MRRRLIAKQSRKLGRVPELFLEEKEDMESRLKNARANVSELLHDAFLVKSARSNEKQWHSLNAREKLLFLEAVSKQWNAWQENAAATVIAEARVIWRALRKARFARSCHAVAVCACGQKRGQEHSRKSIGHESIRSQCRFWIRRSRCAGHSQRLTNRLSRSHECPAGYQCQ